MKLLVTGAGGMLGHDVIDAARQAGHEAIGLTRGELDVRDAAAVLDAVERAEPEAIVNCAAWTDVDGAESAEQQALAINGPGAGNVARSGPPVIHISTDYVFDGHTTRPYLESDATAPRSAYGRTKLAGELEVLAAGQAVVRTSWLFGAAGRNFVATMLSLAEQREQLQVVDDQVGCPTFTGHLAPALVRLAEAHATGIHHVAATGRCSWMEFAREIFAQAGRSCDVQPMSSDKLDRPAPRPPWSVLGTERREAPPLAPWQEGLAAYLEQIAAVRR